MSYDNLSSVSQNVLKFYQQLTVKRGGSLSFLVGTISNVLVMEIGWTDVGSGGYILVILICFCHDIAEILLIWKHQTIITHSIKIIVVYYCECYLLTDGASMYIIVKRIVICIDKKRAFLNWACICDSSRG